MSARTGWFLAACLAAAFFPRLSHADDAAPPAPAAEPAAAEPEPEPEAVVAAAIPQVCNYRSAAWDVQHRRFVEQGRVSKPYSAVAGDERSPDDPRCTLCEEDQAWVQPEEIGLPGIGPFRICRVYKPRIVQALRAIARDGGFDVQVVVGYRAGRTRGPMSGGLRTGFSNHAYGMAIDINSGANGLYSRCNVSAIDRQALRGCRLVMGGRWDPQARPRTTITPQSVVHRAFTRFWRWGGDIAGDQRDLMHFSATGY